MLSRNYKTYKPFVDVLRENSVSSPDDPFQGKEPGASHRFEQTKHDSATFARHLAVLNDQFIDQCSTSDSRAPASRTDTRSSVYSVTKSVHLDNSPLPYLDTSAVKIEQTLDYEELRGQDLSSHQAMSEEIDRFFNAPQDTTAPEKEAEVNLSRSALGEAYSYLRSTSTNRTPALTEADSSEDKSRISELFGSEGFDHNMNSEPWLTQETPATLYPLEFTTSLEILDKYFKPSALTADPPKPKRKRLTASSSFDLSESQQTVPTTCERHGKVPKLSYDCIKD
ncbi:MAG: hypothetical protein M1827_005588 [Pycnora praestabilis]|nr:MAG: hypothetical protein M1827_005588 [Pycnora praestabilis]